MENAGGIFYGVTIETAKALDAQKKLDAGFDQMQTGMDKTDKSAAKLGGGLTKLATAFAGLASAAAIASQFRQAVDVTRAFNVAVSNLGALTGATGKDLQFLSDTAREFGKTTTLSATQAAEALKLVASAKPELLSNAEALKQVTKESVTLAEAAGITLPQAAAALTTTLNQFQLGAEESSRVINVLAAGAKEGASEIADTVAVLQEAGVVASQSGVGIEEFNGAVQALAKGAITGSRAGTGLRNVLTILNTQANDQLKPSVVGLSQALANLEAQGLDDTQMVKLFGRENITAANVLIQFREEADRVTTAITGTGEAYRQASANNNNLEGDTKKLKSAYEELQITIGTLADDSLRSLTQAMTELTTSVANNPEAIANFFKIAGTAAAAFATVMTAKVVVALAASATSAAAAGMAHLALARQMGVAAVAAKGLRVAMAFLGGPLGVAMLAAVAILSFTDRAETAEERTAELDASVQDLTKSFKDLSATQLNAKLAEFAVEAAELEGQIDRLKNKQVAANKEFATTSGVLGGSAASISQYANATSDLAEQDTEGLDLTQRLEANKLAAEAAKKAIDDLGKSVAAPAVSVVTGTASGGGEADKKAARETDRLAQAIRDQVEDLQFQADTLGMTASELEIYKLELLKASDAQIQAAQSSLSLIDAFNAQAEAEKKIQQQREAFGATPQEVTAKVTGQVDPLSGGMFDDQTARYEAEAEAERVRYEQQLARLNEAKMLQLEVTGGYQAQELLLAQTHADRLKQIEAAKNQALLASGQQLFDGLASATAQFAGEQSGAYAAMFAVSKAFAVAQAGLQLSAALTQVLGDPTALTPAQKFANVAAVAAAGGALVSAVGSASYSGRAMGGPVQANQMYRVNETGAPEIFNAANGRQYMMPNQRGDVVSNKNATDGGAGEPTVIVNIQNNADGSTATASSRREDSQTIIDVVVSNMMSNGKIAQATNRITGTKRAGG